MNMKTTIKILSAFALCGLVFQSCLKDQDDLFEETPSARMTEYLANAKKVLMTPSQGWVMYYYPDDAQSYGGINYMVKFGEESADVSYEYAEKPDEPVSSLYRLGSDNGPVLSFDTYNTFMHAFSTPSSSAYQSYGGDFEFTLLEVEYDHVRMMGRRSGNIIVMKPLTEDWTSYLEKIKSVSEDFFIGGFEGTLGGQAVTGTFDHDYQQLTVKTGDEENRVAFMYSTDGIRLYEPLEIGGLKVEEFVYDSEKYTLTVAGTSETVQGTFAEGYRFYDDYAGDYWLVYNRENEEDIVYDSLAVTLTPGVKNSTYLMKGLNDNYDIVWNYSKSEGTLSWSVQLLGYLSDGSYVRLCAYDAATGGFSWATNTMGITEWNGDEAKPEYRVYPQYTWSSTRKSNSFYLCRWDASGTCKYAPATSTGYRFPGNIYSIKWIYSLVKK